LHLIAELCVNIQNNSMICPNCKSSVPDNSPVCPECGQNLRSFMKDVPVSADINTGNPWSQTISQPLPRAIPTNMVFAIIGTLLFSPCGIVAVINAAKVSLLIQAGQVEEARKASKNAVYWSLAAVLVGLAVMVFFPTALKDMMASMPVK